MDFMEQHVKFIAVYLEQTSLQQIISVHLH